MKSGKRAFARARDGLCRWPWRGLADLRRARARWRGLPALWLWPPLGVRCGLRGGFGTDPLGSWLECQTRFLPAAISSMVRPVATEFGFSSRMSGSDLLARVLVGRLDQQPRLLPFARPLAHAHQMPVALQLLAVQLEIEWPFASPCADRARASRCRGPRSSPCRRRIRPWGSCPRICCIRSGGPRRAWRAAFRRARGSARASPPSSSSRRRARAAGRSAAASRVLLDDEARSRSCGPPLPRGSAVLPKSRLAR